MEIDYKNDNFIREVETCTKYNLQRKPDLKKLIDISVSNNKVKEFEELTFTAKYICGMMRVLKNAPAISEVQNTEQIKEDLNNNLKKILEQLRVIIKIGDNEMQNYFEKNYLSFSSQNIVNINQLLSDLEFVKKYINYLKRKSE